MARCKYCHAEILWFDTAKGKRMPVDAKAFKRAVRFNRNGQTVVKIVETFTPHFDTCKPLGELATIARNIDQDYDQARIDPDNKAAYSHWNEEADQMYYAEHPEIFGR